MDNRQLFEELVRTAERLGVEVRLESFETAAMRAGGLCVLRGKRLVLIDQSARVEDRVVALARALSEVETDSIYMVPEARELVELIRVGRIRDAGLSPRRGFVN